MAVLIKEKARKCKGRGVVSHCDHTLIEYPRNETFPTEIATWDQAKRRGGVHRCLSRLSVDGRTQRLATCWVEIVAMFSTQPIPESANAGGAGSCRNCST